MAILRSRWLGLLTNLMLFFSLGLLVVVRCDPWATESGTFERYERHGLRGASPALHLIISRVNGFVGLNL